MQYQDFEIRLSRCGDGDDVVTATWGDKIASVPFHAGIEARVAFRSVEAPRVEVDPIREFVGARDEPALVTPAEAGSRLYEAVFVGAVSDLFTKALGDIGSNHERGVRLRVVLDPGMPASMGLPWELLYSRQRDFLALDPRTPIVRRLATDADPHSLLAPTLLRVLVLISSPVGYRALDTKKERKAIEVALKHHQVDVVVIENATVDRMLRCLADRRRPIHVVHFIGHGSFHAGVGHLAFEDGAGRAHPVTGTDLARSLAGRTTIRLAFLNACQTATTGSVAAGGHPFSGVATALVQHRFPAVVAMQQPIADLDAIEFSRTVYAQLARGASVEAAVSDGRKSLQGMGRNGAAWAIPSIFSSLADSRIFPEINRGHPRRIWSALWTLLGIATLAVSLNVWSQTQGWDIGWVVPKKGRHAVATYGTLVGGCLTVLMLLLTNAYCRRVRDEGIEERLPVAFLAPLDDFPAFKRAFQWFFLALFLAVPTGAQVHFLVKIVNGTYSEKPTRQHPTPEKMSGSEHFTRYVSPMVLMNQDVTYLLDTDGPVSYFPPYEAWAVALFVAGLTVGFVKTTLAVAIRRVVKPALDNP